MELGLLSAKVIEILAASFRIAPIFLSSSMTPFSRLPSIAKIILGLFVGLFAVINTDLSLDQSQLSTSSILFILLNEFLLGWIFVFGFIAIQSAIMTLGRMIEMQIGFGAAGIINPQSNQTESVVGTALTMVSILLLFAVNADHIFIQTVWSSFAVAPLGFVLQGNAHEYLVPTLAAQFYLALLLVLPISLSLLALDMVIGYLSKTMPQMNIYFVSLPLKISLGIMVFAFSAPLMLEHFKLMFQELIGYWRVVLG